MKKVFVLFCLVLIAFSVLGQSGGTGISSNPYWGDISTNTIWSVGTYPGDIIYIGTPANNDLRIITNGHLTINPGVTLVFKELGSDLIITGTGQLTAGGTGVAVKFTKDPSKANWGHISFESMGSAGASIIDNCIIEYGDVSGAALPNRYGGGIHTSFTNLTISNCLIRNNKAGFGGGIFVNKNASPSISNCIIRNNTSSSSGGGLYIWSNSISLVTNCLIFSNVSTSGGGGGGVFLGDLCANVKFYNCTIVNNNCGTNGKNINLYLNTNSTRPSFINCIIWGPANSVYYTSPQTPRSTDFVNCAILNPVAGSTTNSISLNALNTDPSGPNFTSTTDNNWFISPVSPCVNAGLDNSFDPNVPLLDISGKTRSGQTDIGANEAWGFYWVGKDNLNPTVWNNANNWYSNVVPSGDEDVLIPGGLINYPVSSSSQDYTIHAGRSLIIGPGARATFGTLTNNGKLKLNASSAGLASLIVNTYTKGAGATEEIQLFLTGGGTKTPLTYKWHYISSPVSSLSVNTFSPSVTLDLAQWIESRPATSLTQGWVAFDGYIYSTGGMGGPTFSTFTPGKGYDYYKNSDYTFTFSGQLNTGDVNSNLSYTAGNDNLYGLNLVGNPFCSGLDWNYITSHSFPGNTTKSLFFTRNSVLCTYVNGVGVPADVNGIIPPMQAFFTKTTSTGNTIVFPSAARTHNNVHSTYKGLAVIPLVRLSLTDDTLSDETVVRFDDLAKPVFDYDFDAIKMFLNPDLTSIYSSFSGIDYAINGLPFPETSIEIPVTLNLTTDTILKTISATQIEGLDDYEVTLHDNTTGFTSNLKTNPSMIINATKGNIAGRFILKISKTATGFENTPVTTGKFNIYSANKNINIQTFADEWDGKNGSVKVFDLTGKVVINLDKASFSKNSLLYVPENLNQGIYIVELKTGFMKYVGKVVIK